MKKIALFLVLMTTLLSCSIDKPDTYTTQILAVDSYTLPPTLIVGTVYEIKLKYQKPTACHVYGGIYYFSENKTRTIAVYSSIKDGETCTGAVPPLTEVSFNFKPDAAGTYTFKFYKGLDAAGKDKFEEVEVVVTAAT